MSVEEETSRRLRNVFGFLHQPLTQLVGQLHPLVSCISRRLTLGTWELAI